MTKNYKDMTQEEIKDLLSEKTAELYELRKEIKGESKFDILFFSSIGVIDGDYLAGSSSVIGHTFDLASLLDSTKSYKGIVNVLQMCKSQNFSVMMTTRRTKTMYYEIGDIIRKNIHVNGFDFKLFILKVIWAYQYKLKI